MRVITLNVNGICAAARKGFFDWLKDRMRILFASIEIKACSEITNSDQFHPVGYHCYYHTADKSGYSGVGICCRNKPDRVATYLGWNFIDKEGCYIQVDFSSLSVVSLYSTIRHNGKASPKGQV